MKLISICPRCKGETAWDNYFKEARCMSCSYSGNGKLPDDQPIPQGYGKNEVYPKRIRFAIYHPVFEWSSAPVFEKWALDAVVRISPPNSKKPFKYVLEAVNAMPCGLWPNEIMDTQYHYGRKVVDRMIREFREAIREAIIKKLQCERKDIKGIGRVVDLAVERSDIRGKQYVTNIENVG